VTVSQIYSERMIRPFTVMKIHKMITNLMRKRQKI